MHELLVCFSGLFPSKEHRAKLMSSQGGIEHVK